MGENGEMVPYHSCPMLFIPETVWEWWERYNYRERFPHTAPRFEEEDPRFLQFERRYLARRGELQLKMKATGGAA